MGKGDKSSGSNTDPESYVLKAMSHVIWTDRSLLNWSTVSGFCQIMSSPVVRVDRGYAGLSEPEVSPALSLWSLLSLDSGLCLRPGSSPAEGMTILCFSLFSEPGDLSVDMELISFCFLSWQLCHWECWFPPRILPFHCRVWAACGPHNYPMASHKGYFFSTAECGLPGALTTIPWHSPFPHMKTHDSEQQ